MWNLFTLQSYVQQFLVACYMILAQLKQRLYWQQLSWITPPRALLHCVRCHHASLWLHSQKDTPIQEVWATFTLVRLQKRPLLPHRYKPLHELVHSIAVIFYLQRCKHSQSLQSKVRTSKCCSITVLVSVLHVAWEQGYGLLWKFIKWVSNHSVFWLRNQWFSNYRAHTLWFLYQMWFVDL